MKRVLTILLVVPFVACFAQAEDKKAHRVIDPDQAYKNNCTRCHSETPQYSPRMTKTIMMHMHVRANLPADEAQAILEYLNGASPAQESTKEPSAANHAP